jgi:UDP-N-acetylglucosamine diphosphorylase / glucose-1-phosphate thymidylyltransferase / UDP-N-acetylgalactosamine diphosphorylase / glucosamine-1-phosphate N-acetyltransferase / galactosamine-1-phosphate N-acetyltransferase
MNDTVILFEDEVYRTFLPLVYSRPVFELRCGLYTARERTAALLGRPPATLCRAHLAGVHGAGRWPLALLSESAPVTFVNGRALDMPWLPRLLAESTNTVYVADAGPGLLRGEVLLGARLSPALASAVLFYLMAQQTEPALAELRRFARVVEVEARLLTFLWDIITTNGEQIARDLPLFVAQMGWPSAAERPIEDPHVVVRNPAQVYISAGAKLDGPVVLDARDGPVVVDAAHVEPFSSIQGPAAIGAGAIIARGRILAETTIGPVCRIGGEVEASVVQGYSNKHHDGFLGHSYLGEWVNIGAMTTNSDLKNTYGTIRMVLEGFGQVDSGVLKLGCFLADHVKLGIGLHLNGGAVIGTGSNIFGVHFAPKTIPPFTWGGEVFREYRIDGMVDVARKVMGRRKIALTPQQEAVLREVFAMTRGSRAAMTGAAAERAPGAEADSSEAALARAEAEAILAFEPAPSRKT